jgi:O-antigen/teichoic acid export membrane protein
MSELKQSTQKALVWSAVDRAGQQVFVLLVSLTAMRWWLTPEDFGRVAPLALFTSIAGLLIDGGFSLALIRKTDITERDYNTMFWFNVGLGLLFYGILFVISPMIAHLNRMPELTEVARWQFLSLVFSAVGLIHSVQLFRRNDFRRVAQANVMSVFSGAATVIVLSAMGYGYWALVGQALVAAVSKTLTLWVLSGWRPRLMFYWSSVRQVFGFSSKLILGDLADRVSANYYNSALGSDISKAQLGLYNRANNIKDTASGFLNHIFGGSIVVMLSRLQGEPDRFRAAFRKSLRALSFLLFPATLGLLVTAPQVIVLVITDKWLAAVPFIRLLCFSSLFTLLNTQHANAMKIRGRSDITLIFSIVNAVLLVVFLPLTIRYGLQTAIVADMAVRLIVYCCYGTASARILGYRWVDQLRDLAPYAGLSAAMVAAIWPLQYVIGNALLLLLAQIALGAVVYLGATYLLGSRVFEEVRMMLKKSDNKT